ncbi:MAG TPA: transglycosylase domain-containing protein [Candidatus Saccharimonadia bacterium]|nr:transglycosylase domain-containing protein [Candidatus Saccharimonadia bacterium]
MPKRHVRRAARPIEDHTPGFKGHLKRFFLSFTPRYFKSYWISRDGLARIGKLAGAGVLLVFLVFLWYAKDLPTPGKINARITAQTTKFYDSTGQHLLYEVYGNQNRSIVPFSDIPTDAREATIAIEDRHFYDEGAFSTLGILRAALVDITSRSTIQGGSTITQQYVKNALLDPADHSFSRKIKELILSLEIEQFYSKNDILALYLNEIPYGNNSYGVESACKTFFPQDIDHSTTDQLCAKNLDLGQSALLAAILNAPTYYSPYGANYEQLLDRQHLVLNLMAQQKYITQAQANAAMWDYAKLKAERNPNQDLYANLDPRMASFVLYAQDYLENKYGAPLVTEGGLKVITTLDYNKQIQAYNAVKEGMPNVRALGGSNAAFVATDPNSGHILAMLGSYDFNDPNFGAFNVATAERQPGSSFKPIVYSTLFATNENAPCAKTRACPTYGPGTTMYDVQTNFGTASDPYIPHNFSGTNYGIVTIRQALAGSLNIPAVKALAMAGIPQSIATAQRLGITTLSTAPNAYGLSLVLGSGGVQLTQMTNAYESFANGGLHYQQTPILKVYDQKGNVMLDNTKPAKPTQALDSQVAYLIANMLDDNNAKDYIFHGILSVKNNCGDNSDTDCVHVGVKTGTTDDVRDAWTIGFTRNIVAGVWAGNNDDSPMTLEASDISAPIWEDFMNAVLNGSPTPAWVAPPGIKTVTLDKVTGRSVTTATTERTVDVFPSWYTPMTSADGQSAQVDKVSGLLATSCTPPLALESVYSSAILPEITYNQNPSQYDNWLVALQRAGYATSGGELPTKSDDVHSCSDTKPTATIVGANGGGPYNFNVDVTSGSPFTPDRLQVYFDDQIISTQSISGAGTYPISYTPTETGNHTFKAIVTDSGLYTGEADQAVTVTSTGTGSAFVGQSPSDGSQNQPGQINFNWAADDGASSYTLFVDNQSRGSTTSTSQSANVFSPGNHIWYVQADNGDTTSPINFTVQ